MSGAFINGNIDWGLLSKVGMHHDKIKSTRRRKRLSKRRQERALKAQEPKQDKPSKGFQ